MARAVEHGGLTDVEHDAGGRSTALAVGRRGGPERELWPATFVFDGLGRPRRDAAALVQTRPEPARLLAVGSAVELRAANPGVRERAAVEVLAPAPVNAHTHLDLSHMPLAAGAYPDFVAAVVAHGRAGRRGRAAAEAGLTELRAAGITTVGDIVTDESVLELLLAARDLRGVAYWEVLGPDPADADDVFERVADVVRRHRPRERAGGVRLGLSPHAPHTVSAPLLRRLAVFARREALPLQIHVAEDPGETRLHRHGDGPLRAAFGAYLSAFRPSGRSPVAYLDELGVLAARPTLIHGIHVDDDDLRRIQRAGCVVVHCPRSNALLGCGTFPWAAYARVGVSVALGTDSRGSSPSLSVADEWGAARAVHGAAADPTQLLWAAVKGGHRALGTPPPTLLRGALARELAAWPAAAAWPPAGGPGAMGDVTAGPG